MHLPEPLVLALKHRRAEVTAHPFKTLLVERVHGGDLLPPEVEEDLKRPPVPDRRDVQLQGGICRVLTRLVEVGTVPGLVPAVPLDGDAGGAEPGEVDLQGGLQFQEFAAPAVVLPGRPGLLDRLEEVAAFFDDLDVLRRRELHRLGGELEPGVDEERLLHPCLPREMEDGGAVLAAGERDVHARPVVHVLFDGADGVAFKVFQVVAVLLDHLVPARVGPGAGRNRDEFLHPDLPVLDDTGAEPVLVGDDDRPVGHPPRRQGEPFPADAALMRAHGGLGLEIDDASRCIRQDVRECFGSDIEAELPRDRVEREPAEPVAVDDHEVRPVGAAGLVQEHDAGGQGGDIAEPFGKKTAYEGRIRCEGRADVVRLQELDLPDPRLAGAGAPDEGDVALVAPVENFFYCRFAVHVKNSWFSADIKGTGGGGAGGVERPPSRPPQEQAETGNEDGQQDRRNREESGLGIPLRLNAGGNPDPVR